MRLQEYSANGSPVAAAMNNLRAEPAAAACDWFSLEQLAHGSERVGGMVVRSAQVRKVLKTISRLSPYKATVLIHGESGTGKELVARALHTLGSAPGGPFVTFNCSNLVETLAESQLFGHVRGAFTDAREDSLGYFRSANGGTLFLDEIGELPLRLQPKLLRAVETHEIQPVGSSRCYSVDIRLVAATNRDLRAMVKAGSVPRRPLLPPQRRRHPGSPAARAARGDPGLRRSFHRALQPALRQRRKSRYPAPRWTQYAPISGSATSASSAMRSRARS